MVMFNSNFLFKARDSLLLQAYLPHNFDNTYSAELYSLSGKRFENMTKLEWPNIFYEEIDRNEYNQYDTIDIEFFGFASINGLLCVLKSYNFKRGLSVVLWNPATEEFKIIPSSSVESCLLQSPSTAYSWPEFYVHEFGYDNVTDDYKVIRHISFLHYPNSYNFPLSPTQISLWEIYSLRGNSWRTLDFDMPISCQNAYLYLDGFCHWLCYYSNIAPYELFEVCLGSFKLSTETFFTTRIPYLDHNDYFVSRRHLSVLYGTIALMTYHEFTTTFHISILCELGVKESWTKLYSVGVGPSPCVQLSIGLGKKAEIFFIRKPDGKLIWLDLNNRMIEEVDDCKKWRFKYVYYQENLLPIQGLDSANV
jgi:F-box interacting protein